MDMIERVWVIGIDYGYEGKEVPDMAFLTKDAAEQAAKLVQGKNHVQTCYVAEVPVWRCGQSPLNEKDPTVLRAGD